MKVILTQDLKGKGKKGDVIVVNDGYAHNFLLPNGVAIPANASNLNVNNQAKASETHKQEVIFAEAQEAYKKLNKTTVVLYVKTGDTGKIFGSITSAEIASEIEKTGVVVDKKKIELDSPIKSTGLFSVKVKLHPKVTATVNVQVEKQ